MCWMRRWWWRWWCTRKWNSVVMYSVACLAVVKKKLWHAQKKKSKLTSWQQRRRKNGANNSETVISSWIYGSAGVCVCVHTSASIIGAHSNYNFIKRDKWCTNYGLQFSIPYALLFFFFFFSFKYLRCVRVFFLRLVFFFALGGKTARQCVDENKSKSKP